MTIEADKLAEQLRAVTDFLGQPQFDCDYVRQFRKDSRERLAAYDAHRAQGDGKVEPEVKCIWYGRSLGEHSYIDIPGGKRCIKCKHEIAAPAEQQAAHPAGTCRVTDADVERAISYIIREICESDIAPPGKETTVCIHVDELEKIVRANVESFAATRAQQAVEDAK